jgi:optic atrophy 3 protein
MRMRLGLLQDPAVIDRQIAKEVKAAEAARKKSQIPTVKTEAETVAEEAMTQQEREAARKKIETALKPRIRPLSETKAIEMGANFAAETFIFAVGIGVIIFEQWRQRRKARNQRDDIREDLEELQIELKTVKAELEEMKARHPESTTGKIIGFLKGKNGDKKSDATIHAEAPASPNEAQTSISMPPPSNPPSSSSTPGTK